MLFVVARVGFRFGYFKVKNAAKDDPEKQKKARLDLIASLADWLRVTPVC
jgi:hypothetical protein